MDGVAKNSAEDHSAVAPERQISPVGRRPHLRPSWLLQAPPEPSGKGTQWCRGLDIICPDTVCIVSYGCCNKPHKLSDFKQHKSSILQL